jgi:hypothetical protein
MKWIQHYARPGLPDKDLKAYLRQSHRLVALGLSRKKRAELGLDFEERGKAPASSGNQAKAAQSRALGSARRRA